MSCVNVYRVRRNGRLELCDEVPNAGAFHIVLWDVLSSKYGYRNEEEYPYILADPGVVEET